MEKFGMLKKYGNVKHPNPEVRCGPWEFGRTQKGYPMVEIIPLTNPTVLEI